MKLTSTLSNSVIFILLALLMSFAGQSQDLLQNSNLSNGANHWNYQGMKVEINPESVYGGSNRYNYTAEIDHQVGLRQLVSVTKGFSYQFTFLASRRTAGGTISNPGIQVKIYGAKSGQNYVSDLKTFNNTRFSFSTLEYSFTVPANSTDESVVVEITAYNNSTTLGVIVDNLQMFQTAFLPVEFISFSGTCRQQKVNLQWTTAHEMSNDHFVVEHSADGKTFDSVGRVQPSAIGQYQFADPTLRQGTQYYRIRQVDVDGRFLFSKTIQVETSRSAGTTMQLFPVPAQNNIHIRLQVDSPVQAKLVVYDLGGRPVLIAACNLNPGVQEQVLDCSQLRTGEYFVRISANDGSLQTSGKFSKI